MNTRTLTVPGALCAVVLAAAPLPAQSLLGPKAPALQHVTAAASTAPAGAAAGKIALHLDVSPKPAIHVYAPGAKEFSPVSLVLTPPPGVTPAAPVYPAAHPAAVGEDDTPAYRKPFRITVPVTVAPAAGDVVIAGVLTYQACDDRLCYPVASLPVSWTIAHGSGRPR